MREPGVWTAVRTPTIVLTPPTGQRSVPNEPPRRRRRSAARRVRDFVVGEPTSAHFAFAAALYCLVPWTLARLRDISLSRDVLVSAAGYLMWGGNPDSSESLTSLFEVATSVNLAAAAV